MNETEPTITSSLPAYQNSSPLTTNTTATTSKRARSNHLLAGSSGGLIASSLLQPFDVIKTRIQQGQHGSLMSVISKTILHSPSPHLPTHDHLTSTPLARQQKRRWLNLWRGTLPSILRSSIGSGLYFFTLNEMRTHFSSSTSTAAGSRQEGATSALPVLSGQLNLLTGATARATVGFVMMPITIIKVRYESDLYNYKSMVHATREIYGSHGVRGFFYGFGATAIRDAPYAGLYVYVYELSKGYFGGLLPGGSRSQIETLSVNFGSGLVAGFGATLLTNPFDVMRTRMQLRPALYKNFWTAARRMYLEDGPRSFLDGVGLRIARKSISSAFTWSLYEFVLASI